MSKAHFHQCVHGLGRKPTKCLIENSETMDSSKCHWTSYNFKDRFKFFNVMSILVYFYALI
jgi:hypothetical protein